MSVPDSEVAENITNGLNANEFEDNTEVCSETIKQEQNYDQEHNHVQETSLNNLINELKEESSVQEYSGEHITATSVTSRQTFSSQITSTQIIGTQVTSPDVTAAQVTSPDVTAKQVASPDVTATQETSPDVTTTQVTSSDVSATQVTSPDVTTTQVTSPDVTTTQVTSADVSVTVATDTQVPVPERESEETQESSIENHVRDQIVLESKGQEQVHSDISVNQEPSESSIQLIQEEVNSSENKQIHSFPKKKEDSSSSEIQEEGLRNKLHEIIQEISLEVPLDENEPRHHTWQPKGKYEVPKTEIKYEEVVPCDVPDVDIKERQKVAAEKSQKFNKMTLKKEKVATSYEEVSSEFASEETRRQYSIDAQKILRNALMNGEPISPQEIPIGIPLLAKILPREESGDEEPHEKIPLERLFTPATDAENLIPLKKKRAFASSCFYRPDHPTIDDQVELAHKISTSLIDENNKSSRGQNMYMKRKNRSSKWIHEGGATQTREAWHQETLVQEEKKSSKEKPQLKLVLSPKKVQDFNDAQKYYEELMATSLESTRHLTRMEVGKEIATNLESPTGKGAALFAKRKKRMDKFIVDESTIHQQQQQEQQQQNIQETVSSELSSLINEQNSTFSTLESNSLYENGFQSNHDSSLGALNATDQIYKAEVTLVQKPSSASPALDITAPFSIHKLINEGDFPARHEDKRKSFNLAPKGWGTYNTFYTPVHLEAK